MLTERLLSAAVRIGSRHAMQLEPAGEDFVLPAPRAGRRYLLYVHVPFCPVLCPFCSFHRVELREDKARRYFPALWLQIEGYADAGFQLSGVYVGGGTPTADPEALRATLALIRRRFGVLPISVETNPSDLRPGITDMLVEAGVSRLSVGVQSFDDGLLRRMGRYEKYGSGIEVRERLRSVAGLFPTLNVDMIFNLPGQSEVDLDRDVQAIIDEPSIDQVSFYPLMSTAATRRAMRGSMGDATADHEARYFQRLRSALEHTHRPSSVWCFARHAGMIDEYIVTDDEYLGAGSGAFGYLDGTFYSNTFSLARYAACLGSGRSPVTMYRQMGRREQMRYDFLVKLFGLSVAKAALEEKYGGRFLRTMWPEIAFFKSLGALRDDGATLSLTEAGMYAWVVMMREFLSGVNRFREQLRLNIRDEYPAASLRARRPAAEALE
jgi:menaquinone C8-methyltransferase